MVKMDKRQRAQLFRERIKDAMTSKGVTKSALSRATETDRSTIGQLLNSDQPRLPNAQLAAEAAHALGVSADWLLGLTNRPETAGDIVAVGGVCGAGCSDPAARCGIGAKLSAFLCGGVGSGGVL